MVAARRRPEREDKAVQNWNFSADPLKDTPAPETVSPEAAAPSTPAPVAADAAIPEPAAGDTALAPEAPQPKAGSGA